MSEETHKFSKQQEFIDDVSFGRNIKNYFNKIQKIFSPKKKPSLDLHGRIHEVDEDCKKLIKDLTKLKSTATSKLDVVAAPHFIAVVDGFIKELSRIQKESERTLDITHRVKITSRFKAWTEEVRAWIELEKKFDKPKQIHQSILQYNIHEYEKKIDKDLQVVEDYVRHALLECGEDEEGRAKLRQQVMKQVEPLLEKLHQLKSYKTATSIEELTVWRVQADHDRGKCFSDALHAVDSVFHRTEFIDHMENF